MMLPSQQHPFPISWTRFHALLEAFACSLLCWITVAAAHVYCCFFLFIKGFCWNFDFCWYCLCVPITFLIFSKILYFFFGKFILSWITVASVLDYGSCRTCLLLFFLFSKVFFGISIFADVVCVPRLVLSFFQKFYIFLKNSFCFSHYH